jgi:hypothetical protein
MPIPWKEWIEQENPLAIEDQRREEIMNRFNEPFSISFTIWTYQFPIPELPKIKLKEDRDIPKIKDEICEFAWAVMKKAVDQIDPNWLDLGNYIVRKELEWDMNGKLYEMQQDGLFVDFDVRCNNINNPPEVFKAHALVLDLLIAWEHGFMPNKITLRIDKHKDE